MDKLVVEGGFQLNGSIKSSGAKNSALPILAASILLDDPIIIRNIPHLNDVTTMLELLGSMGVDMTLSEDMEVELDPSGLNDVGARYELVKTMRASVLVLGPLLAKTGYAKVALPGGCAIGSRPVNLHIDIMKKMGSEIFIKDGYIEAKSNGRLKGCEFHFDLVSVTATENALMAACLAEGTSILKNCAREPEVSDLANCLNDCGAKISGIGSDELVIEGVKELHGTSFSIMPDRIETATYLVATTMTGGEITIKNCQPNSLGAVITKLEEAGANIVCKENEINLKMKEELPKSTSLSTAPFPSFPTDMQAQFIALNSISNGSATVTETVFENRFMHVNELIRMGGDIELRGNTAFIKGKGRKLIAAPVMATDLRASASLVLAGLVAKGETLVDRIYHIDRGYERIEEKLKLLGAKIERIST